MKNKRNTRRGFTLIELLVVILIIGILAAVAVPQYQKAVEKSQFAALKNTALTLKKAVEIYNLENGNWPLSLDELNIEFSGQKASDYCQINSDMYCCLLPPVKSAHAGQIVCGQPDYSFGYKAYFSTANGIPLNSNSCVEDTNKFFCQFITKRKGSSSKVITPDGFKDIRECSLD